MAKGKRIEIATLERAQHEDLMRGDAFTMAVVGQIMRGLYDDRRWPITYPGLAQRVTATETPLRGHVLSGLMVRPDNGAYLLVDPGTLLAAVPAASSDDSILEVIEDPGVSSTSTLLFVANAAGSVRLDIVEVSIVDTVLEQPTRGVFNTTTRAFDPTAVPKVKAPQLSYRIRQGVAGSGLPAMASGWLPLAVVCHQPSTTSFANCDMWDVRPLVADLVPLGTPLADPVGTIAGHAAQVQGYYYSTPSECRGSVLSEFNGYLAGGEILKSTADALASFGSAYIYLDPVDVKNQEAGFVLPVNRIVHMAACFPGGLPRWVRYSQINVAAVAARIPMGPRGILVMTTAQPTMTGYFAAVTLPAVCGFAAAVPGISLMAMATNGTPALVGCTCSRETVYSSDLASVLVDPTGLTTGTVTWSLDPAAKRFPEEATELYLAFGFNFAAVGPLIVTISVKFGGSLVVHKIPVAFDAPGQAGYCNLWVPVTHRAIVDTSLATSIVATTGATTITAANAQVIGWKMQ